MRISDWSSDVCSSDLDDGARVPAPAHAAGAVPAGLHRLRETDGRQQLPGRADRSEERRVGKECVRTFRSRGSPDHQKKKRTYRILTGDLKSEIKNTS